MGAIKYKAGYKYQLVEDYRVDLSGHLPHSNVVGNYYLLSGGTLTVTAGYAWDGPSGPTFDTKAFMRGSLVHDVLYQMIRNKQVGHPTIDIRKVADNILKQLVREDGMSAIRAYWVYRAVRLFGAKAASKPKKVFTAP